MPTIVKIGVIGAGSAQFSLGLVKDLCLTEGLAGSHVCFMDVNQERLEMIHKLAARYAAEMGSGLTFDRTTDQRDCLQNADFIINTAYVKGHRHEQAMRDRVAKHGYYYHGVNLGDFYQLRLSLDLARNMEEICPHAWLIQSANPLFNCCTLVTRKTDIKTCGLCHGHYGYHEVAEAIGLDPARINAQAPGLNHDIWLTHFFYDGKNAYPLIDEWIETKAEEYWRTHIANHTHDIQMSRAAVHQYRMYGLFPIGDTVRRGGGSASTSQRGEWWYRTDLETEKYWFGESWGGPDTELARRYFVENLEKRVAEMTRLANDPKAKLVEAFGSTKTNEQIVPIIDALVNDHQGQFQVNVPNQGVLERLPDDVVVEVPAIVSKKGIQPIHIGSLPPKIIFECILPHWLEMERNLLSFQTCDRSVLLWNALDSQQTRSYDQAVAVLEDLLAMDDNREMAEHYRFPSSW